MFSILSFALSFVAFRSPCILRTVWVCVVTSARVLLGTDASVAPGKADLRVSIFVFAGAFAVSCKDDWSMGDARKVVLQSVSSIFALLLPS